MPFPLSWWPRPGPRPDEERGPGPRGGGGAGAPLRARIALALISKEVYSSLFLGCLAAALLLANFSPWQMVVNLIGADSSSGVGLINSVTDNVAILIFLVILGIMVI